VTVFASKVGFNFYRRRHANALVFAGAFCVSRTKFLKVWYIGGNERNHKGASVKQLLLCLLVLLLAILPVAAQEDPVLPVINHQTVMPDPIFDYGLPDGHTGYGLAVDIDGEWLVVGAHSSKVIGVQGRGAVYIYRHGIDGWSLHTRIVNPTDSANSYGCEVAFDNTTLAVIHLGEGVYIYNFDGATWQETVFFPIEITGWVQCSLALKNGVMAVGDRRDNVYVYRRDEFGGWSHETTLTSILANENYSWSVALSDDGNTLAAGAPPGEYAGGQVYLYNFDGSTWQPEASTLTEPAMGAFGGSVEFLGSGDDLLLAVGAPSNAPNTHLIPGTVHLYSRTGGVWSKILLLTDQLTYPQGGSGRFGGNLKFIGELGNAVLLVSSIVDTPGPDITGYIPARIYVFDLIGNQLAEIVSPVAVDENNDGFADKDAFGESIAVDGVGDNLKIAVSGRLAYDVGLGRVYIFDHDPNAIELVENGDFEQSPERGIILDKWKKTPGAKLLCDGTGAASLCGVRFKGGVRAKVWQRIDLSQVALSPGDALLVQADVNVRQKAALRLKLKVVYADGYRQIAKVVVKNTKGEYKRVLSAPGLFIANRPISKIVVIGIANGRKGRVRLDNVSLVWVGGS
jgi:hypothetical protein